MKRAKRDIKVGRTFTYCTVTLTSFRICRRHYRPRSAILACILWSCLRKWTPVFTVALNKL